MKAILADDEEIITRGIQKLIDWESLGIEFVGIYEDGKKAFEGILTKKPEIALLDISMPGMSGIEILRECRMMGIRTSIVFISGFQDFEYARDALKYGAVEYLLKPVIREELIGALEKCFSQMRQNRYEKAGGEKEKETDLSGLLQTEDTCYIPVLVQVIHRDVMEEKMRKLAESSASSFLEKYIESRHLGIYKKRPYSGYHEGNGQNAVQGGPGASGGKSKRGDPAETVLRDGKDGGADERSGAGFSGLSRKERLSVFC